MKGVNYMKWDKFVSIGIAGVGTLASKYLGGADEILTVLISLMVLDYILGLMCGFREKKLSSKIGFFGVLKKITILIVIAVAVAIDTQTSSQGLVRNMAIYFYAAMEGISILENAGRMGVPIPEKLKDALLQLKEGNKKDITDSMKGD